MEDAPGHSEPEISTQGINDLLKEVDWLSVAKLMERTLNLVAAGKVDTYSCAVEGMAAWYSAGLMFFGRPELIVCSQDSEVGQQVLGHFIEHGGDLQDGEGIALTEQVAVASKAMTSKCASHYLTMAGIIHGCTLHREYTGSEGDYPRLPDASKPDLLARQLVFSDEAGRFPWHPGFRAVIEQPKLWRDAASERSLS
jgi:hypothetical protein